MNDSEWDYVDDPTVAVDGTGAAIVAWVDQARRDVLLRVFGPGGEPRPGSPVNVSRSPDVFSWLPRIVVSRDDPDRIHVLWQEIVFSGGSHGGEIFFARSTDGGRSFEPPVNLSQSRAGDGKGRLSPQLWDNGSLDLVEGPDGTLYAAWTEYEGRLWFRRSADGGRGFGEKIQVGGSDSRPARTPTLAAGPDGTVHLAWSVGEGPEADLRIATSRDGGRSFDGPRAILPGEAHADAPRLLLDPSGILHLAYAESPTGRGGPYVVRHARAGPGAGSFGGDRRISDPDGGSAGFPELAAGPGGGLHALWHLFVRAEDLRPRGVVHGTSRDGRIRFDSALLPGTPVTGDGITGSLQGRPMRRLAVDPDGRAVVVYSTFRTDDGSRIWLLREGRPAP